MKYRTLGKTSEGIHKEKGSKFLAFAFPVRSELEINTHLTALRKKFHDASHHCYAYILGKDKKDFRANDDGEPGHSAGDPILGQIRSHDLTNALIVVIRYFGGVKLGVGGLIQAYRESAAAAIATNEVIEMEDFHLLSIKFDYLLLNEAMRLIKEQQLRIVQQSFDNDCWIEISVSESKFGETRQKFLAIPGISLD